MVNLEDEEMTVEPISGSSKLEHPTSDETLVSNFDNGDGDNGDDDELMIDDNNATASKLIVPNGAPYFPPLSEAALQAARVKKSEMRRIPIPPHRMTPLKKDWLSIFSPLTEMLGLQVRMNVQRRSVEMRVRSLGS